MKKDSGIFPKTKTELEQIIRERISVRAFLKDKPIAEGLLEEVIELASRAPSWKNAQSYLLIALSGNTRDNLCAELTEAAKNGVEHNPDFEYEKNYPAFIKKRMYDLGMSLYAHLGIGRKDKEKRDAQMLRNFIGFDAPYLVLCYIPSALRDWSILDLGIFLGHICLTAGQYGLGTCFQSTLAAYPDIVKKYTEMGDDYKLVVGFSIGYPDPEDRCNSFISGRAPLEEIFNVIS
jgi:nitroreductase